MAYLSTPCTDAFLGKQCINKAIEVLFSAQGSDDSEDHLETTSENIENAKPTLIWNCVYVQEITQVCLYLISTMTVLFIPALVKVCAAHVHIYVFVLKTSAVLSSTSREHLVLYYHAPCLMKIWTTGIYWNQQKRYCTVMIYFTLELV
jgi:hypothetical protein